MKKIFAIAAVALIGLPGAAMAQGLIGQCADCHTMHNSEQGVAVALQGSATEPTGVANQNLLRMDCIACHASGNSATSIMTMEGGSAVPQVLHSDFTNDLAAGNFQHLAEGTDRKGHNIVDLFGADADNAYLAPGDIRAHNFGPGTGTTGFTCAGAVGCHGTRSQLAAGYTDTTVEPNVWVTEAKRQGIAAISGAHHNNYDGLKTPEQNIAAVHDGSRVADGYRFIPGLIGKGNETDRWQNASSTSHNEYYGDATSGINIIGPGTSNCNVCHVPGEIPGASPRMTFDSTLGVPNQSMSGFCMTCHGNFHSSGIGNDYGSVNNGTSGAFLRHPSDFTIPNRGEYAAYTEYNITAPVARPDLVGGAFAADAVRPGTDMVMCLSCHQAHATPFDGMLRFDYDLQVAGEGDLGEGCMACHTTKGVSKQ